MNQPRFPLGSPALPSSTTFTPVLHSSWTSRAEQPLMGKRIPRPSSPSSPTSTLGIRIRYRGDSSSDMCKCALSSLLQPPLIMTLGKDCRKKNGPNVRLTTLMRQHSIDRWNPWYWSFPCTYRSPFTRNPGYRLTGCVLCD